jgi:hypothetical protein
MGFNKIRRLRLRLRLRLRMQRMAGGQASVSPTLLRT